MFPRRYFAGRHFAPRYFPQSQGEEAAVSHFWRLDEKSLGFDNSTDKTLSFDNRTSRTLTFNKEID